MVRLIMHGCNGKMGQTISRIVKEDHGAEIVCHFCNTRYRFEEADLRKLLE